MTSVASTNALQKITKCTIYIKYVNIQYIPIVCTIKDYVNTVTNTCTVMQMIKSGEPSMQDRGVQWMCSGRCGGGSVYQTFLCRRQVPADKSRHTPILSVPWKDVAFPLCQAVFMLQSKHLDLPFHPCRESSCAFLWIPLYVTPTKACQLCCVWVWCEFTGICQEGNRQSLKFKFNFIHSD